ncbi:MAG: M15 family metallopeptidase [Ruminococcus sp.]|nr:M15 family metallopeptidase [Ruminococcus sp.]
MKTTRRFLSLVAAAALLFLAACGNTGSDTKRKRFAEPTATETDAPDETVTSAQESSLAATEASSETTTTSQTTTTTTTTTTTSQTTTASETTSETQPVQTETQILIIEYNTEEVPVDQGGQADTGSSSQESQTAAQTTTTTAPPAPPELKGEMTVIDGVTYIDGILIVNKTYSLPPDYGPGYVLPEPQAAFNEMAAAAQKDGIYLWICSGYRSYAYQQQLYNNYWYYRGAETDRFSARPGHSEHQTGLCMDLNNASRTFVGTPEAIWIENHCADFGFIIRYPDGKEEVTGFMYEPWHVRYVGKELARYLTDNGLTLEEYFGITSVYAD